MKKAYVTPTVEKVEFKYEKVVAYSGPWSDWGQSGVKSCTHDNNPYLTGSTCSEK